MKKIETLKNYVNFFSNIIYVSFLVGDFFTIKEDFFGKFFALKDLNIAKRCFFQNQKGQLLQFFAAYQKVDEGSSLFSSSPTGLSKEAP